MLISVVQFGRRLIVVVGLQSLLESHCCGSVVELTTLIYIIP